jgi:hypothetical protein
MTFSCPSCATAFTVPDDKAGKRTTCPKCKTRLTVPDAPVEPVVRVRPWPPSKTRVAVVVLALGLVALAVYVVSRLPNPTESDVVNSLKRKLPPGYEDLDFDKYDRGEGTLRFRVKYRDYGDPLGVRYEVSRYYASTDPTGKGWRVQVIGRRAQFDKPYDQWLVVEVVFDAKGKLVHKRSVTAAGADEGPVLEEKARNIAAAVNDTF